MLTNRTSGFTIVEILIVIVVIGILAGVGVASYNGVQMRASNSLVQSDATKAANFLESTFLKTGSFPASGTDLSQSGADASTTMTYQSNGAAYCLEIGSTKAGTKKYTIRDDANLAEGVCAGWVPSSGTTTPATPSDPSPTVASITTNSFVFSWSAVSGATGYTVHLGTTTSSGVPNGSAPGCAPTTALTCTISGLASDTNYHVGLSANVSGGSNYYGYQTVLTKVPAPTVSNVTYTVSTAKNTAGDNVERYVITGTGSACSVGTIQWNMSVTGGSVPYWGAWVANNVQTKEVEHTGIYSAFDVTIYTKARCVSGTNISVDSNIRSTTRGTGGGGGGGSI